MPSLTMVLERLAEVGRQKSLTKHVHFSSILFVLLLGLTHTLCSYEADGSGDAGAGSVPCAYAEAPARAARISQSAVNMRQRWHHGGIKGPRNREHKRKYFAASWQ